MKIMQLLAVLCALEMVLSTTALARTKSMQVGAVPVQENAQVNRTVFIGSKSGFILRQDLFDRLNPNNIRTDWPAPSAQPGQH